MTLDDGTKAVFAALDRLQQIVDEQVQLLLTTGSERRGVAARTLPGCADRLRFRREIAVEGAKKLAAPFALRTLVRGDERGLIAARIEEQALDHRQPHCTGAKLLNVGVSDRAVRLEHTGDRGRPKRPELNPGGNSQA